MKIVPFSSLAPAVQQKAITEMREDYAFRQHVIYLIRKDIATELNKYSRNEMREVFVNFPCLRESIETLSLSFIVHYLVETKGYLERFINRSLDDRFLFSFRPEIYYEDFSSVRIRYSSDTDEPVLICGNFGKLQGNDLGETDEMIFETLYSSVKDSGEYLLLNSREIYEKCLSEEYVKDYIELMDFRFSEDGIIRFMSRSQ